MVSNMPNLTPEASHRQSRAMVAKALISLHEAGELDEPEQWTWPRVDVMPLWCLLELEERRQFQRLCGFLIHAPAVARWLDGRCIRAVHNIVGINIAEQIIDEALSLEAEQGTNADSAEFISAPEADAVEDFLLHAGGSVLRCSLDPTLPVARLGESLEDAGLDVPATVARAILNRAHALQSSAMVADSQTQVEQAPTVGAVSLNEAVKDDTLKQSEVHP